MGSGIKLKGHRTKPCQKCRIMCRKCESALNVVKLIATVIVMVRVTPSEKDDICIYIYIYMYIYIYIYVYIYIYINMYIQTHM